MTDSIDTSEREAEDPRQPIRLPVREMRDEPVPARSADDNLPPLPTANFSAWMHDGRGCDPDLLRPYPRAVNAFNWGPYKSDRDRDYWFEKGYWADPLYTADQMHEFARAAIAAHCGKGEPVMIYHGRHTIDCGEFGSHDMEMLKLIPAGTKLYTSPRTANAVDAAYLRRLIDAIQKDVRKVVGFGYGQAAIHLMADRFKEAVEEAIAATKEKA